MENEIKNKYCGVTGELFVVAIEKDILVKNGCQELAAKVRHIADIQGDGTGYDIESFTPDGNVKYIKVKTTFGGNLTPFFMTANEVRSLSMPRRIIIFTVFMILIKLKTRASFLS
jgi:hypothetical protein